MKITQSLTAMITVAVMVYAASLPTTTPKPRDIKHELRKEIHAEAMNVSKHKQVKGEMVRATSDGDPVYNDEFFCLAEKSLKSASHQRKIHAEKLSRLLEQYNNKTGHNHCSLNSVKNCTLAKLLEDIVTCVDHMELSCALYGKNC